MRILLIEDDSMLAQTMVRMLEQAQHQVDWINDGRKGLNALKDQTFDIAIADLTLPRLDGLEIVRQARKAQCRTPIIILTAREELDDRVQGLDFGADDYLTKPFKMAELEARMRAVIRRTDGYTDNNVLTSGTIRLNLDHAELQVGEKRFQLPKAEFQILQVLMRNTDRVATRRRLEEVLYGWDRGAESNTLEVHIHHLRQRLGKSVIRTVRGVGYTLDSEAAKDAG
ncbi:response regulator transcription factor [Marinimicrobium sp. C6131]|jgi:two-component system OmpR family response regulator/two-component system response regulator QseB|uniref:response regulator transcription factor n=1 Tax=Marinimicrobium sp. C6131 TaxID=3022676 RepID=UPI00223D2D31|nr:response regulator transcription factor [Marinimicrobium sp. C6131]UZJ43417.1 response regulator transcription factor [Marinimicrobium sp. C6131]|tara:strand:- start:179 stop:859 length:681 start_codon:yes stop_codon:yes gene_type:complete